MSIHTKRPKTPCKRKRVAPISLKAHEQRSQRKNRPALLRAARSQRCRRKTVGSVVQCILDCRTHTAAWFCVFMEQNLPLWFLIV